MPPKKCVAMATLVNLRSLIPSIMPTWVLRKPALQIPMAVKTQIPLASIMPLSRNWGTMDIAAPTDPREVTGKAMACGSVKPSSGVTTKDSCSPTQGKNEIPS
jgi:hypothetical protein